MGREKELRELVAVRKSIAVIASALETTVDAVYLKCRRLGLQVEEDARRYTSSSIKFPKELPSVEEALKK